MPQHLLPEFNFHVNGRSQPVEASSNPPSAPPPPPEPPPEPSEMAPAFDVLDADRLLARLGGDRDALVEIAQTMRLDLTERMEQLRIAAASRDAGLASRQSHALKGSLATLTLDRGAALARGLELAAQKGEWTLYGRALKLLEHEAVRIDAALATLTNS
jgi:HPt (histidine-containing phosphotransfer) domain-containing protein